MNAHCPILCQAWVKQPISVIRNSIEGIIYFGIPSAQYKAGRLDNVEKDLRLRDE